MIFVFRYVQTYVQPYNKVMSMMSNIVLSVERMSMQKDFEAEHLCIVPQEWKFRM